MNRFWIMLWIFPLFLSCQSLPKEQGLVKLEGHPVEFSVNGAFKEMIHNAQQPELTLGTVYFDFDEANLSDHSKKTLDSIVPEIGIRQGPVIVEGHADHVNTDAYNQKLGYARALIVADYLKSAGVWEERLYVRSFGENRPTTTNWSDEGRMMNRRVVIKIYPQGEGMSGTDAERAIKAMQSTEKKSADGNQAELMLNIGESSGGGE